MPWLARRGSPHPPLATPPPSLGPTPPPPPCTAPPPALTCPPRQMLEALDTPPPSDPFVDAVRAFLDRTPRWSGPATDLLKLLPLCKNPRGLSKQTQHE